MSPQPQEESAPLVISNYSIAQFIADIEVVMDTTSDEHEIVDEVERRLTHLVRTPQFLPEQFQESWEDRFRPHLVAVAPSRRFSIVALVWQPGQHTAVHDHICWCVVGVACGVEIEKRFHLRENAQGERWLQPDGIDIMLPGMTAALVPPAENIHEVSNEGVEKAISIHVYGADLSTMPTPSSSNEFFDDVPVRDDGEGKLVPWRKMR